MTALPQVPPVPVRPPVPTLALMRRLFAYQPGLFARNLALWGAFHTAPALFCSSGEAWSSALSSPRRSPSSL